MGDHNNKKKRNQDLFFTSDIWTSRNGKQYFTDEEVPDAIRELSINDGKLVADPDCSSLHLVKKNWQTSVTKNKKTRHLCCYFKTTIRGGCGWKVQQVYSYETKTTCFRIGNVPHSHHIMSTAIKAKMLLSSPSKLCITPKEFGLLYTRSYDNVDTNNELKNAISTFMNVKYNICRNHLEEFKNNEDNNNNNNNNKNVNDENNNNVPKRSSSVILDEIKKNYKKARICNNKTHNNKEDNTTVNDSITADEEEQQRVNEEDINNNNKKKRDKKLHEMSINEIEKICYNDLNSSSWKIVQTAFKILFQYTFNQDNLNYYYGTKFCHIIIKNQFIPFIINAISRFITNCAVISNGLDLLINLCTNGNGNIIPTESIIAIINVTVMAMQTHTTEVCIQESCCWVLHNIFLYSQKPMIHYNAAKHMGVLQLVISAMEKYTKCEGIQRYGCCVLQQCYDNLNDDDTIRNTMKDTCLGVLAKAVRNKSYPIRKSALVLMKKLINDIEAETTDEK